MQPHDVTPLITVDPFVDAPASVDQAVVLVEAGQRVMVADDDTARAVLVQLGLTEEQAADQVRVSHGPMA